MFKTASQNSQRRLARKQIREIAAAGAAEPERRPSVRFVMAVQELDRQIALSAPGSDSRKKLEHRKMELQRRQAGAGRGA